MSVMLMTKLPVNLNLQTIHPILIIAFSPLNIYDSLSDHIIPPLQTLHYGGMEMRRKKGRLIFGDSPSPQNKC